jgi:hypothetical protein
VATAGQAEIDMRFKPLLQMADQFMWFKYVLKNVAYKAGHTVTFMPKPLFEDNGTGMHTHLSIWKDGQAAVCRRQIRRCLPGRPVGHRRHPEALQSTVRLYQPDYQLVQTSGAGI